MLARRCDFGYFADVVCIYDPMQTGRLSSLRGACRVRARRLRARPGGPYDPAVALSQVLGVSVTSNLYLFAAFGAGVISFVSPCVLPIVPGYLSLGHRAVGR